MISPSTLFTESPDKDVRVATPYPPESVIVRFKVVPLAGVSREAGFLILEMVTFALDPPETAELSLNLIEVDV